jgi:hypothetical protein
LAFTDTFDNGVLSVKVLTTLTAPVASSTIEMQVFVRGAETMEFANPHVNSTTVSAFQLQSEEYSEKREGTRMDVGTVPDDAIDERSRLHFGENVGSLRPLLRRSNWLDAITPAASTNYGAWQLRHYRFPPYAGFDPGAWDQAKGVVATTTDFGFNYTRMTPWHYIANCFLAQRGSVHWHYNWVGPQDVSITATRRTLSSTLSKAYVGAAVGTANVNAKTLWVNMAHTGPGTALVNQKTNAGLSVSIPNYSAFKFESTDVLNSTVPVSTGGRYDGSIYEGVDVQVFAQPTVPLETGTLHRYFGVGTDYSLYFFLNCPSLTYYTVSSIVPV